MAPGILFRHDDEFIIWPIEKRTCFISSGSMDVLGTTVEKRTSDLRNQLDTQMSFGGKIVPRECI